MTDNKLGDLKARLRKLNHVWVEQRTGEQCDVGKTAANALDARDAEIARLREALVADLDRARQWYNCVEDVNPQFLEPEDRAALDRLLQIALNGGDDEG